MVKGGWRQGTVLCLLFIDRRQRTVPCLPNQRSLSGRSFFHSKIAPLPRRFYFIKLLYVLTTDNLHEMY